MPLTTKQSKRRDLLWGIVVVLELLTLCVILPG